MSEAKHKPAPHHAAWAAIRTARRWLTTDRPEAQANALVALREVRDDPGLPEAVLADAAPELLAESRRLIAAMDALHDAAHRSWPAEQWYERECLLRDLQNKKLDADASLRAAIAKATPRTP